MTKKDLEVILLEKKIRKDSYSLSGGLPNEAYCIHENDFGWEVYYSERGNKTGLKIFQNENEACSYFCDLIFGIAK